VQGGVATNGAGAGGAPAQAGAGGQQAMPAGGGGLSAMAGSGGAPSGGGGAGASTGGSSGQGGSGGGPPKDPFPPPDIACDDPWPAPVSTEEISETIAVTGVFDGGMKRYVGVGALGSETQSEDQPAFFRLAHGSVLKNVILGKPASDGIHCDGSCFLQNVWWEDVGEDAATLDGTDPAQVMTVQCAGARHAADKVFQHNGPGTMILRDIVVEDFGKFYRSCGNCLDQYQRHAVLQNITAEDGEAMAGVNQNYDDTVEFDNITVGGGIDICWLYEGNDTDAEPDFLGDGEGTEHCLYDDADIHDL
jgi:hypothetical protein